MSDVTRILDAIQHGDPMAADELLPLVYNELCRTAAHKIANESACHTLQSIALVCSFPFIRGWRCIDRK